MLANLAIVLAQWNVLARDVNALAFAMDDSALVPNASACAPNVSVRLANVFNCAVNVLIVVVNVPSAALIAFDDNLAPANPVLDICYAKPYAHKTACPLLLGSPGENPFVFGFEPNPFEPFETLLFLVLNLTLLNLLNLVLAKPV